MNKEQEDKIISQALEILAGRLKSGSVINSPDTAKNYIRLLIADEKSEVFFILFLNTQHQVIAEEILFRGTIDACSVYPREVIKAALSWNAAAVMLAHQHPSGNGEPSMADIRITETLKNALDVVDIRLLDHFIVTLTTTISFAERGLL